MMTRRWSTSDSSVVGRGGVVGRLLKKLFADVWLQGAGSGRRRAPTHWTKRPAGGTRSAPVSSSAAARAAEVGLVEYGHRTYTESGTGSLMR